MVHRKTPQRRFPLLVGYLALAVSIGSMSRAARSFAAETAVSVSAETAASVSAETAASVSAETAASVSEGPAADDSVVLPSGSAGGGENPGTTAKTESAEKSDSGVATANASTPSDAGYAQAIEAQMTTLVTGSVNTFFTRAGQPKPDAIEVTTHATFGVSAAAEGSEPRLTSLDLHVTLVTDQPANVVRDARQALLRTLRGNGYRTSEDSAGAPSDGRILPVANLILQVTAPVLRAGSSGWQEYTVFILLVLGALAGVGLTIYLFMLPLRPGRGQALAAARHSTKPATAPGFAASPAQMRQEPELGLPRTTPRAPLKAPMTVAARELGPPPNAAATVPRATTPAPSLPVALQAATARVTPREILGAAASLEVTPPQNPSGATTDSPTTTRKSPANQATPALHQATATRKPTVSPSVKPATATATAKPAAAPVAAPRVLADQLDLPELARGTQQTVRQAFTGLPFEKALTLLASADQHTRETLIAKLQLRAPVRERLERELRELPP